MEAGKPVPAICSERCKEIDLGAWASGQYKIGSTDEEPPTDEPQGDLN